MKYSFLISAISVVLSSCSAQQQWTKVVVDESASYEVAKEGEFYKTTTHGPKGMTNADLIINGDSLKTIRSGKASLQGQTLTITLFQTTPGYHHELVITVRKDAFKTKYQFMTSGEEIDRTFETKDSKLTLNTLEFKKGKFAKGHLEYFGLCTKGCAKKEYSISGDFSVQIE